MSDTRVSESERDVFPLSEAESLGSVSRRQHQTTTISTVAVQAGTSRIVLAILKVGIIFVLGFFFQCDPAVTDCLLVVEACNYLCDDDLSVTDLFLI